MENKNKILNLFFTRPMSKFHIRELSRITKIPRTSISQAVNECREYIQQTLKQRGIE